MVASPVVPGVNASAELVKVVLVRHNVPSLRCEWNRYEREIVQNNIHDNSWDPLHYSPLGFQVTRQHHPHLLAGEPPHPFSPMTKRDFSGPPLGNLGLQLGQESLLLFEQCQRVEGEVEVAAQAGL